MRSFDLYFSKQRSFLFPDTRLTWRRLSESYSWNWSQDFLHRVSPGTVFHFEKPMLPSLARRNPIVIHFSQSHSILVVAFSSSLGIVAFLWLFVWLFINLVMREQTLVSGFTTRFIFFELALGRMPILTRRSRASAFQIISARLSKNGTMVTFASDTSFPRRTSTS